MTATGHSFPDLTYSIDAAGPAEIRTGPPAEMIRKRRSPGFVRDRSWLLVRECPLIAMSA